MVLQFVGEYVVAFLYWTPAWKGGGSFFYWSDAVGQALKSSPFFENPLWKQRVFCF